MGRYNPLVHILQVPYYERQPDESTPAWIAFQTYRDMPAHQRSVLEAYRKLKRPHAAQAPGAWNHWVTVWQWMKRAEAWDQHVDLVQREAHEARVRADAERLAEERRKQRMRELELGNKLLERAEQMLQMPVVEVTTERDTDTGKLVQTIKPGKWRVVDAAQIARVGIELKRLGLDMETSRAAVRIDIEEEVRQLARANGWDEEAAVEAALKFAQDRGDRAVG